MSFSTFLPKLLNMSLTAGVVIVFILLLRLWLKKQPKVLSYALWSVVLFRLLCPVSVESNLSLFRLIDLSAQEQRVSTNPIDSFPNPRLSTLSFVWILGTFIMCTYAIISYLRLRSRLIPSSPLRDNIRLADGIASPFVMGLVRPKIYLPSSLSEREQPYILLHEQYHIRRLDHIVKALSFAVLCIHWFNPLVWIAFLLSERDMEMSCDEAVVRKLGDNIRADYSASLLRLATGKTNLAGMPLSFGEGDPGGRIRNLANRSKPTFLRVFPAVIVCIVAAVCLSTNPPAIVHAVYDDGININSNSNPQEWTVEEHTTETERILKLYLTFADGLQKELNVYLLDENSEEHPSNAVKRYMEYTEYMKREEPQ